MKYPSLFVCMWATASKLDTLSCPVAIRTWLLRTIEARKWSTSASLVLEPCLQRHHIAPPHGCAHANPQRHCLVKVDHRHEMWSARGGGLELNRCPRTRSDPGPA